MELGADALPESCGVFEEVRVLSQCGSDFEGEKMPEEAQVAQK